MTKEEKIIATAFTGKMFIDGSDMGLLYEYMEKKVGHGVIDIMLADKGFWEELHKACEQDFIDMVSKEQPYLPSNLDEAEFEYAQSLDEIPANQEEEKMIYDAFKAGAEWMAGQRNVDSMKEALRTEYEKGRADALKDMPRWKRFAPIINDVLSEQRICQELENSVLRVDVGGYCWVISREDLNKLPKEDEK